ncbi:MAG: SO2930 family diheme c-type cytochrome [Polymorphobacter sp.]|uniref:SO2930 family diheme c-type cytochrome n=1 Tax=Polymorphobacter sp. TaxID=1909290 RepID=UPI003A8B41CC
MIRGALLLLASAALVGAAEAPAPDLDRLLAPRPAPMLADYGLFSDAAANSPAARVRPYNLNTQLFTDYADKARFAYLPPGTSARVEGGVIEWPVGTTLIKHFQYGSGADVRRLETRLLIRQQSGWLPVSYVWNEAQTEARLQIAGQTIPLTIPTPAGPRAIDYQVPNRNQCKQCHQQSGAVTPIGPSLANFNTGVQLQSWAAAGVLTDLPDARPRLARWDDPEAPLDARARAWLDVNCGHCHSRAGFASNSGLYLQHDEPDPTHFGVGKRPVAAGRGSGGRMVGIAPGAPEASILVHRIESTEAGVMMPQMGRTLVDEEGAALIRAWIAAMPVGDDD